MIRRTKFTEDRIRHILHEQAVGSTLGELLDRYGISEERYSRWRAKYGEENRAATRGSDNDVESQRARIAPAHGLIVRKRS